MKYKRDMLLSIYPPIMFYNKEDVKKIWEIERPRQTPNYVNIYVHIPFCPRKCDFCFLISEVSGLQKMKQYINKLVEEIEYISQKKYLRDAQIRSITIGGGSPTILPTFLLEELFEALYRRFNIIKGETEIAIEMHPGKEVTEEKLQLLKKYNVIRISIGVESFDDDILALNGRNGTSEDAINTLRKLYQAGFDYVNIDIISGMLGETDKTWNYTIAKLLEMQPQEVTLYKLQLYENSKIAIKCKANGLKVMDDGQEFLFAKRFYDLLFENGYKLSTGTYSFCKHELQHKYRKYRNQGEDLVALGVASNGIIDRCVYQNIISLEKYLETDSHITTSYCMTDEDYFYRSMVLGMRSGRIDVQEIFNRHGINPIEFFKTELTDLQNDGYVTVSEQYIEIINNGIYFADDIIRKNFMPKEIMKMEEMMLKYRNYDLSKNKKGLIKK